MKTLQTRPHQEAWQTKGTPVAEQVAGTPEGPLQQGQICHKAALPSPSPAISQPGPRPGEVFVVKLAGPLDSVGSGELARTPAKNWGQRDIAKRCCQSCIPYQEDRPIPGWGEAGRGVRTSGVGGSQLTAKILLLFQS